MESNFTIGKGLFIFYPAYLAGVLFLRDPKMFRSPFGATLMVLFIGGGLIRGYWWKNGVPRKIIS